MAQKINPNKSEDLIQAARVIPRLAEIVLDDVVNFFERDNTSEPNIILKKISVESEKNLLTAYALLDQLKVNRDAMRRNLDRTHGFIMAQRVAFALSATLGKEEADKLVHAMIHDAIKMKIGFRQALLKNPVSSRLLSPNEIDTLLEPEGYLGLAREEIQAVIVRVEALRRTDPPLR
jgi:adenylosuccinate lyase